MLMRQAILSHVKLASTLGFKSSAFSTSSRAAANKLVLSFQVPHQSIFKGEASQVNLSTTDGDMGILADHVPLIAQLKPGFVEYTPSVGGDAGIKRFFCSGGFAVLNPDSTLTINAVEAFAVEELDVEAAKRGLDTANRVVNNPSSTIEAKTEAQIQVEVFEALVNAK